MRDCIFVCQPGHLFLSFYYFDWCWWVLTRFLCHGLFRQYGHDMHGWCVNIHVCMYAACYWCSDACMGIRMASCLRRPWRKKVEAAIFAFVFKLGGLTRTRNNSGFHMGPWLRLEDIGPIPVHFIIFFYFSKYFTKFCDANYLLLDINTIILKWFILY